MQMLHYWNPIKKAMTFILFFLFWQINLIIVVTSSSSSSSSSNSNNNNNGQLIGIPTPVTDAFEGRVYTYYIKLSKRPYSSSIPSVNVNVNTNCEEEGTRNDLATLGHCSSLLQKK